MPIRPYVCKDCETHFDFFEFPSDPSQPQCTNCQSLKVTKTISAPGGYQINGNNSASVRPRGAGSFRKGKK